MIPCCTCVICDLCYYMFFGSLHCSLSEDVAYVQLCLVAVGQGRVTHVSGGVRARDHVFAVC